MMIVVCILGIFSLVLFSAYNKISEISFRVEQQKRVNEELLFVSEVLQNFANRNSIDFEKYGLTLVDSMGFSDVLYLSGEDGKFKIYSSGNCVDFSQIPDFSNLQDGCALYFQQDWEEESVKLTSDLAYFSKAKFKIIPYSDLYFSSQDDLTLCDTNYFACVNDKWFWLFVDIYPKYYSENVWANDIHILVQDFFNI